MKNKIKKLIGSHYLLIEIRLCTLILLDMNIFLKEYSEKLNVNSSLAGYLEYNLTILLCLAEEDRLTWKCKALFTALSVVYATVYIFNMVYPDEVSITLASSQKYCLILKMGLKRIQKFQDYWQLCYLIKESVVFLKLVTCISWEDRLN